MSAAAISASEDYMQDVAVAIMDAHPMMSNMMSDFTPPLAHQDPSTLYPPSQLLPDGSVYMVKAEQPEELVAPVQSLPDHPSLGFMNVQMESSPMESVEMSAPLSSLVASYDADIAAVAAAAAQGTAVGGPFALVSPTDTTMGLEIPPAALSTASAPLSAIPLAGVVQAPSPPFPVAGSSLDPALLPSAQPHAHPSPPHLPSSSSTQSLSTTSSLSPVPIPVPFIPSVSQSPAAPTVAAPTHTTILPPAEAEKVVIKDEIPIGQQKKEVANLLKALAQDFAVASQAVTTLQDSTDVLPDEIKSRIATLSLLAAQLSLTSSESSPPPTAAMKQPPTPPTSVPVTELHGGYPLPPLTASTSTFDPALSINPASELPRKRSADELDEQRSVKALKREPQDFPLAMVPEALPLDSSAIFPATAAIPSSHAMPAPLPQSRPASRPPTPTSFAAAVAQYNMIPPTIYPPLGSMPQTLSGMSQTAPTAPLASPSQFPSGRVAWGESGVAPSRHHHSLSAGAILNPIQAMPVSPPIPLTSGLVSGPNTPASAYPPPLVRTVRSGSVSSLGFDNGYFYTEKVPELPPVVSGGRPALGSWYFGESSSPTNTSDEPNTARNSPSDDEDDDSSSDDDEDGPAPNKSTTQLSSLDGPPPPGSDIPAEYRQEVDRIFFEYLNNICSNLDARDSKGDQIHQTLMAKKMQRLDESPDFRPFKFRIQAFTSAFLEELARQGYTEDKLPMKKIRNYLWHQPHILRFNEDGKKAKSKGNHIWNVEAKKIGDGKWEFRPFHRKLAGNPPAVAYIGLKWSWTPRVWDPQASFQNVPVQYSSPNLPSWLSWKDDVLSGIPPPDAESCQVTAVASYILDGVEGKLSRTFNITIAPIGAAESHFPRSRRSSQTSEAPRRSASDSALSSAPTRAAKARSSPIVSIPIPNETPATRVIRVLQNVAQRVTAEAESQLVNPTPSSPAAESLQEIVKQKAVLDQTVEAIDKELSGHGGQETKRLAIAAQQVVIQAAANVIADRNVSIGRAPVVPNKSTAVQRVSVSELSDVTHDAIAEAVQINSDGSKCDIFFTATSLLKLKSPVVEPTPSLLPPRSILSMSFATNLSTLPELT